MNRGSGMSGSASAWRIASIAHPRGPYTRARVLRPGRQLYTYTSAWATSHDAAADVKR